MDKPDFGDAELKLGRARKHIAELESSIVALSNPELYRLRMEREDGGRRINAILETTHETTKEINTVIGDAIGNLRSCLDYIAGALVKPAGGDPEKTGFPFAKNKLSFEGEVRKDAFAICGEAFVRHFIDKVQAYKGGTGSALWSLNKLRNIDKHRLLVTTQQLAWITASWRAGNSVNYGCSMGVTAGENGSFFSVPAHNFEFLDQPTASFDISFREPTSVPDFTSAPGFLNGVSGDIQRLLNALKVL